MSDLESVERQIASAWYDECIRLRTALRVMQDDRDTLRNALLTAQGWMPARGQEGNEAAIKDVKEVYAALGWEYVEP